MGVGWGNIGHLIFLHASLIVGLSFQSFTLGIMFQSPPLLCALIVSFLVGSAYSIEVNFTSFLSFNYSEVQKSYTLALVYHSFFSRMLIENYVLCFLERVNWSVKFNRLDFF